MAKKEFLPLRDAREQINLATRSQMQRLFPFLPYLYIEQPRSHSRTRLFPAGYIYGLRHYLDGRSATKALVEAFNATDEARALFEMTQERLAAKIAMDEEYMPHQVAAMLDVHWTTVSGWVRSGALPYEEKRLKDGEIVPKGPRQRRTKGRQFVTAEMLRTVFQWASPFT